MTTVLITGATGQIGTELQRARWPDAVEVVALGRRDLDITDSDAVGGVLDRHRPAMVVNAAAYTAVDRAESEPDAARRLNADAVTVLAEATRRRESTLIQYSTDYVFDGTKQGWYREDDAPNPLGVYGSTKLAGEEQAATNDRHLVLRTSWVYSAHGTNFVKTIRRLAIERDRLDVVADQHGCPTSARDIAGATALLGAQVLDGLEDYGVFHLAAPDATSWFELATCIVDRIDRTHDCEVQPTTTEAYAAPAPRPLNSRLCSEALDSTYGLRLPSWRTSLEGVLDELERLDSHREGA